MRNSTTSFIINFFIRTANQALISSTRVLQGGSVSCITFNDPVFFSVHLLPHTEQRDKCGVLTGSITLSHQAQYMRWALEFGLTLSIFFTSSYTASILDHKCGDNYTCISPTGWYPPSNNTMSQPGKSVYEYSPLQKRHSI